MEPRLAGNSWWSFYLSLLGAGIMVCTTTPAIFFSLYKVFVRHETEKALISPKVDISGCY